MRKLIILFVVLFACVSAGLAQSDAITLKGIVVDQNNAPIAAAQVFLYASPTLLAQTTTGPTGEFIFSQIKVNHGVLKVRAAGFAELEQEWTAANAPLRITLAPLPLRELVVVTPTRTGIQLIGSLFHDRRACFTASHAQLRRLRRRGKSSQPALSDRPHSGYDGWTTTTGSSRY